MYLEVTFADGSTGRYPLSAGATVTVQEPPQTTNGVTSLGPSTTFAVDNATAIGLVFDDLSPTVPVPVAADAPPEAAAEAAPAATPPAEAAVAPETAPVETPAADLPDENTAGSEAAPEAAPVPAVDVLPADAVSSAAATQGPEVAGATAAVVVGLVQNAPPETQPEMAAAALADVQATLALHPDEPGLLAAQTELQSLVASLAPAQ